MSSKLWFLISEALRALAIRFSGLQSVKPRPTDVCNFSTFCNKVRVTECNLVHIPLDVNPLDRFRREFERAAAISVSPILSCCEMSRSPRVNLLRLFSSDYPDVSKARSAFA